MIFNIRGKIINMKEAFVCGPHFVFRQLPAKERINWLEQPHLC